LHIFVFICKHTYIFTQQIKIIFCKNKQICICTRDRWWLIVYFLLVSEFLRQACIYGLEIQAHPSGMLVGRKACSFFSWLCKVANDRAEIRELLRSSCRDSWHVTLCKNVLDVWVSWTEKFYVGHVLQRCTITFTLCYKMSKANRLIDVHVWSPTGDQANRAKMWIFLQNTIYKKSEFTEINYNVPKILFYIIRVSKFFLFNIYFVKIKILEL